MNAIGRYEINVETHTIWLRTQFKLKIARYDFQAHGHDVLCVSGRVSYRRAAIEVSDSLQPLLDRDGFATTLHLSCWCDRVIVLWNERA